MGGKTQMPSPGKGMHPREPTLRLPAFQPIKPGAASTRLYGKVGSNSPNLGAQTVSGDPSPEV